MRGRATRARTKIVTTIAASAPGSLMLLGEHAVLHGHRALVMAVDRRLRVALTPRADNRLTIESALGRHETDLASIAPHPSFRFILESVRRFADRLPSGFDVQVESTFSHEIGYGSSAAVTVATVAAVRRLAALDESVEIIRDDAIAVIRAVQGRGSGADAAASAHGGVVAYRAEPRQARVLPARLRLLAVYCGYKTPTPEVIRRVEATWRNRPDALAEVYRRIDACTGAGIDALERQDFPAFGAALNQGQALMAELGVSTPELDAILARLRADPGILGAKISGSGLGDCAIGLRAPDHREAPAEADPVQTDLVGVRFET